jgi:signal transduction histidine kinase
VTLRLRIFALVAGVVATTVLLVTWLMTARARTAFETVDAGRRAALVTQIRREFDREGEEVTRRLDRIATSEAVIRLTTDAGSLAAAALHVNDAAPMASAVGLDFLDLVSFDGLIMSSAHWPAHFGYRHPWAQAPTLADHAFLDSVELPAGSALGLMARRVAGADRSRVYLAGGRRLDEHFLQSLVLPAGMRAILYRHADVDASGRQLIDATGPVSVSGLEPLIARVRQSGLDATETIRQADGSEIFDAMPFKGRDGRVIAVLLVGSSNRELESLLRRIRWTATAVGAAGIIVGAMFGYVLAARVTQPVEALAEVARTVAAGRWDVPPAVRATGEVGDLASAFSTMTRQLVDQRDRLVQAERVAAWRELARRLAHELKNPLFPLRITVDNLQRARTLPAREFDEVFAESLTTLTTGITNLNTVVGRFSDFSKMPAPVFARIEPNTIVSEALNLFRAQLTAPGRPPIRLVTDLDPALGTIRADADQLSRALQNLLLNAIDAMPNGGDVTVRTRRADGAAHLEVADTGDGLTEEEQQRLFTPYYTTKHHGTGLGLAIVQSVVTDHGGRIRVTSAPGRGTTFDIELPADD